MYLPALARDLYKSQKEVEGIEKQLQETTEAAGQEKLKISCVRQKPNWPS